MADKPSITHLACGKTSFNQHDISKKYCGHCHIFMAKGTYEITEPEIKGTDGPSGGFWVNAIVAQRDSRPYIQLSNEKGMLAQFTMSQARQIANDMILACSRAEADAILIRFFQKHELPEGALAEIMGDFRDFRYELDQEKAERPE